MPRYTTKVVIGHAFTQEDLTGCPHRYVHASRNDDETPLCHLERVIKRYPYLKPYLSLNTYTQERELPNAGIYEWSRSFVFEGDNVRCRITPGTTIDVTPDEIKVFIR